MGLGMDMGLGMAWGMSIGHEHGHDFFILQLIIFTLCNMQYAICNYNLQFYILDSTMYNLLYIFFLQSYLQFTFDILQIFYFQYTILPFAK